MPWILATHTDFDGSTLTRANQCDLPATPTPLPAGLPIGLTSTFADDAQKQQQWTAFGRRNGLETPPLTEVVLLLGLFLTPALAASRTQEDLEAKFPGNAPEHGACGRARRGKQEYARVGAWP
jgi:hypothetical protein